MVPLKISKHHTGGSISNSCELSILSMGSERS